MLRSYIIATHQQILRRNSNLRMRKPIFESYNYIDTPKLVLIKKTPACIAN